MTAEPTPPIDPHGLLASGEELATEGELAKLLGVPRTALHSLLHGPLYELVRFVRMPKPGTWRFSVADGRLAIEPHRAAIAERRRLADERQAAEQAAAKTRREAKAAGAPKSLRAPPTTIKPPDDRSRRVTPGEPPPSQGHRAASRSPSSGPEVVIVRRRPGAIGGVRT